MATILVVDDIAANRDLFATLLRYVGHTVLEAGDGEEALLRVREHRPDLVICDILMPTMDGYEFARRLREEPAIRATEIIFCTATFLEREARALASSCGVSRVLTKPCEPEDILRAVAEALRDTPLDLAPAADDVAFEHQHLHLVRDKLLQKAQELERANERLAALHELSLLLSSEREPSVLMEKFCRGIRALFGTHSAYLIVREKAQGTVRLVSAGASADAVRRAEGLKTHLMDACAAVDAQRPHRLGPVEFDSAGPLLPIVDCLRQHLDGVHSALLAPLVSLQHHYGWVVLVDKLGAQGFEASDEATLAVQAAQAGRIYENGSLYLRVQNQLSQLQAQAAERERADALLRLEHAVAKALASADELVAGVCAVLQVVCESQQWEVARYWQADEGAGVLRLLAQWNALGLPVAPQEAVVRQIVMRKGDGLAGRVWESAEPLWVSDLREDPRALHKGDLAPGSSASVSVVPVISGGDTLGVLAFLVRGCRALDVRMQASAQVLAHQLGQFIRRKVAEHRSQRLHRVATVLSDINALIVRARARDELFGEACRIAVDTGRFKRAWIGIFQREHSEIKIVAGRSASAEGPEYFAAIHDALQPQFRDGGEQFRQVVERREPLFENDIANSAWMVMREQALASGSRSLAVLPLIVGGETVGLLVLHAHEVGYFDDEERKMLMELAGNLSFAMDHLAQAEQINRLAYYDALTGHANGMLFRERLAQQLAAHAQRPLMLVVLDLERFRAINDGLGRHAGDDLLRQVSARIANVCGGPSHMARVGPDQFAIMFPDAAPGLEAARLADEFHAQCFAQPFFIAMSELRVGARMGVALFPGDGVEADVLYQHAEAALKRAKSAVERLLFYDVRMTESIAEKQALENRLREALQNDRFVLHYQPKVHCVTGEVVGLEALIRWVDPTRGLVPPGKFIPLMEETGLIIEVGSWALHKAAADYRAWCARAGSAPRIAVNVSAIQLQHKDFLTVLETALRGEGERAGIDLEITESAILQNIDETVHTLQAVRAFGVGIAIDDFGTGYSSLAYLAKLPVQTLKIDQTFIASMLTDANAQTLVQTMISLAHALRMNLVAEGVEHQAQALALREMGCDLMQGYLISKPQPEEELWNWLTTGIVVK